MNFEDYHLLIMLKGGRLVGKEAYYTKDRDGETEVPCFRHWYTLPGGSAMVLTASNYDYEWEYRVNTYDPHTWELAPSYRKSIDGYIIRYRSHLSCST